ncbi:unnamed protein product [Colias eurytheme]|nr:unnamed protein product [Colias eurytheme]
MGTGVVLEDAFQRVVCDERSSERARPPQLSLQGRWRQDGALPGGAGSSQAGAAGGSLSRRQGERRGDTGRKPACVRVQSGHVERIAGPCFAQQTRLISCKEGKRYRHSAQFSQTVCTFNAKGNYNMAHSASPRLSYNVPTKLIPLVA